MTSLGAEIVTSQFMPTFKVKGQIYSKADALLLFPDSQHKLLQMHFIGVRKDELDARCANSADKKMPSLPNCKSFFAIKSSLRLLNTAVEVMPSNIHKIFIHVDKTPDLQWRNDHLTTFAETHRC